MAARALDRISFASPTPTVAVRHSCIRRQFGRWMGMGLVVWSAVCVQPIDAADAPKPAVGKSAPSPKATNTDATVASKSKTSEAAGIEFFEKQVRPLLAKHCLECHSTADGQAVKGGLALDSRTGWMAGGESGPVITPGDPDGSLLIEAVRYDGFEMPPKGKLPAKDIAVLERWVKMGAPDPREGQAPAVAKAAEKLDLEKARSFWSFQPPEARRAPETKNAAWPNCDIDRFVLAKLEAEGLSPAPDAEPAQWLRRVTYDLIGLPPTPDEQASFLADSSSRARERVVDRLLKSPEFGVHWGRHWLDVARYADSNGSDFNSKFANAWRYRNYVIDALNRDKPYDLFVTEQLAGDLMPVDNDAQRAERLIATTFLNVGSKMLSERDKEKLALDVVDEQLDTLGKAFLGMTLGCARCHDHKFDPIPTTDYYAMAGILRSTVTLEGESQQYVSTWVETPLPMTPEHAALVKAHQQKIGEKQAKLDAAKQSLTAAEAKLAALDDTARSVVVDDAQAEVVGAWVASKYSPNFVGVGYLHDDKNGKGEKSITWTPDLPRAGKYEVRVAFAGNGGRADAVPVTIRHADAETVVKVDQSRKAKIDKLYEPVGVFRFEKGRAGSVSMSNLGTTGYVLADAVEFVPVDVDAAVAKASNTSDMKAAATVRAAAEKAAKEEIAKATAQIGELETDLAALKKQAPTPTPMAMAAREAPQIDDCQICIRGEVSNRGPKVVRGFLQVASDGTKQLVDPQQSGRLELARWIVRPDNPLTARVMVNRIWQHVFGEGIVATVDNFGLLGSLPSHPELLDTLSVEFVESGWSTKQLVRRLVLSRTYAQSTKFDQRSFEKDPENALLWRAHRKRLPAEAIRDSLLATAGDLDSKLGISPLKGAGESSGNKDAQPRSVYLPIVRNELAGFLTVFDFADPDVSTGRRSETNVPAQALYLLNDPLVRTEAARIAERIMHDSSSDDERIDAAYRLILCRSASDDELTRANAFLEQVRNPEPGRDAESGKASTREFESWRQFAQALVASTEFRWLD